MPRKSLQDIPADRRCSAVKADGSPCGGWSVIGSEPKLCSGHLGRNVAKALAAKRQKATAKLDEQIAEHDPSEPVNEGERRTNEFIEAMERRRLALLPPERTAVMIEHRLVWVRSHYGPGMEPPPDAALDEHGTAFRWVPMSIEDETERALYTAGLREAAVRDRDFDQRTVYERARWRAKRAELRTMAKQFPDGLYRWLDKEPELQQYLDHEDPPWLDGIAVDLNVEAEDSADVAFVRDYIAAWRAKGGWASSLPS